MLQIFGGLSEWSKVTVLKAVVLKGQLTEFFNWYFCLHGFYDTIFYKL